MPVVEVPEDIHRKLKEIAAREGRYLKSLVAEILEKWIKQYEQEEKIAKRVFERAIKEMEDVITEG